VSDITPDPLVRPVGALPPELSPRGYTKPRRRASRLFAWVAIITSAVVLIGSGSLYAAYHKLDSNINRVHIAALDNKGTAPAGGAGTTAIGKGGVARPVKPKGAEKDLNFLILGSDSRAGATDAELQAFGTQFEAGQRSDTMLLVNIPANRDGAYVLSFPRDLYVDIPGEGKHKINSAFGKGGADLTIRTVEALTNIHIDHYLEVNFASFLRMVDALDGVDICVPKAMKSKDAALNLPAGKQRLTGSKALSYVRARNFDPDSAYQDPTADLGRIGRQQQFLGALIRRATSSSTLLRPDRLARFLSRATSALTTDDGLHIGDLKNLALRFRNLDPKKVVFATVPNYDPGHKISGQSVVLVDEAPAEEIFGAIRDGSMRADGTIPPPPAAAAGPKLTVAPAGIRVRVLNGTDIAGQARVVRDDLTTRGFVVTEVGTAPVDQRGDTATVVRYGPDRKDAADTLAASIPGSRAELDSTLTRTLTVVVGSGYSGTKAVKVSTPRASGSPSVQAAPKTAADDACA
jgi:LCP family protein required for cell wall assembly